MVLVLTILSAAVSSMRKCNQDFYFKETR